MAPVCKAQYGRNPLSFIAAWLSVKRQKCGEPTEPCRVHLSGKKGKAARPTESKGKESQWETSKMEQTH